MNKRILSLMLAFVMILGTFSIATAATGNAKVDWLIEKGYVTGDSGGYRLNDSIRRSEVAAMVVRSLEMEDVAETLKTIPSSFSDMNIGDAVWAKGYVNYVAGNGYVNGYTDGTFRPSRDITYAEIIKMLVMVNGDLPDTTGYSGPLWAVPYITKAIEVGITQGVTIPNNDYNMPATREKVFELVYNIVIKKVEVELETYKGIVVENSRVSGLDMDEINLVVFARGDNAAEATLRYDKDSEARITLPANLDAEALLGKVVDVTIDKNNNASKVVIDNSYTYINGPIVASEDEISDQNGKTYDVYLEDRFSNSIDRIYGVYHNDKEFDYDEYVEDLDSIDGERDNLFVPEHAKVTVKGSKTFFIDSFTFDDIAPVVEVKKSGDEVYVYDDMISASESKYNLDEVFGYSANGFKSIDLEDIKAGDVIHVYDGDKAIVKQDAVKTGEFDRVLVDEASYARIEGTEYQIRNTSYKRPVYSLDGNKFFTLMATSASTSLAELRGEDVTYIIDINGHLQSITGDIEFSEKVVVMEDLGTRDIDVLDASGNESNLKTDNFTRLFIANSNTPRSLSDFNRGDIAYLFNDGNTVDTLVKMATASNINTNAKKVVKTARGAFDINLTGSWIRLESGIVELTNSTNVFIVEVEGSNVTRIETTTLEGIVDTTKPDTDLRAYVISERDFNSLNVGNEVRVGNAADVAHTIIFTDYVLDDELLNSETIQLLYNYDSDLDDEIIGENEAGKRVEYDVASFANITDLEAGDIVTLNLDNVDKVVSASVRVDEDTEEYEVIEVNGSSSRIRSITVEIDGEEEEVFVSSDVIVFGDDVREGDTVAFDLDDDGDIEVLLVK